MSKLSLLTILVIFGLCSPLTSAIFFHFKIHSNGTANANSNGNGHAGVTARVTKRPVVVGAGVTLKGSAGAGANGKTEAGAHFNLHINFKTGLVGKFLGLLSTVYEAFVKMVSSITGMGTASVQAAIKLWFGSITAAFDALRDMTINTATELKSLLVKFGGLLRVAIKNGDELFGNLWKSGEYVIAADVKFLTGLLEGLFSLTHAFTVQVEAGYHGDGSASGGGHVGGSGGGHIGGGGSGQVGGGGSGQVGGGGSGHVGGGGSGHVGGGGSGHVGGGGGGHFSGGIHIGGGGSGHVGGRPRPTTVRVTEATVGDVEINDEATVGDVEINDETTVEDTETAVEDTETTVFQ